MTGGAVETRRTMALWNPAPVSARCDANGSSLSATW
jgi:hypothetical protein